MRRRANEIKAQCYLELALTSLQHSEHRTLTVLSMTAEELERLVADCPKPYHMASAYSWLSIQKHGLLSTTAILDLARVSEAQRITLEAIKRPESVEIQLPDETWITIRDNKPINESLLARSLTDNLTPTDWYRILNRKVFFWLSKDRLIKLQNAKAYRDQEHHVLELDTRTLIKAHLRNITLSPINSGAVFANPAPRGLDTFLPIQQYPYSRYLHRKSNERVVELAVDYAVPNIEQFATRVLAMRNGKPFRVIFGNEPLDGKRRCVA